jgi:hypothetical protein
VRIQTLAGEQPVSEWVRGALLKAADPPSGDATLLAEVLALRTILLNLNFHLCSGMTVTTETMQRLIERADKDKQQQAEARLGPRARGRPVAARCAGLAAERDADGHRQRRRHVMGPSDVRLDAAALVS